MIPGSRPRDLELDVSLLDSSAAISSPDPWKSTESTLRVLRRADGTLELADLDPARDEAAQPRQLAIAMPRRLIVQIRGGTLTLIDEPSQTRLHMQNVEGEGDPRRPNESVIQQLRGMLNGGPFQFVGELDRTGDEPRFEGRFQAEDVVLDDGMSVLRYAVPVLAGTSLNLKGHLDTDLYLQGRGATWRRMSQSLAGHGVIAINPIDLDGAPLVAELSKIAELSRQGRVAPSVPISWSRIGGSRPIISRSTSAGSP